MAKTATKKWTKATIKAAIIAAAAEKGDTPTSTDMTNRKYGLPYPQAVINAYGNIPAAIRAAGFTPKGKPQSKAARAKIKDGLTRKSVKKSTATAKAPRAVVKKAAGTAKPSAKVKSAVADTLSTAFSKQEFCNHCEQTFVGEHTAEQCRDNLHARVTAMRTAAENFLPAALV